jgi:CheY-like chemotaxis protein
MDDPRAQAPHSRRLLVIDDKPEFLRILKVTLSKEHEVVTAQGCDAALAVLQADARFDGVLCDVMMPFGDGMSFYERLGQVAPELTAKVLFMTGGACTERARTFLESVPNKTIEKPFTPESLRRLLEEL